MLLDKWIYYVVLPKTYYFFMDFSISKLYSSNYLLTGFFRLTQPKYNLPWTRPKTLLTYE